MGTPKAPVNSEHEPPLSSQILNRGIAAYQQVVRSKDEAREETSGGIPAGSADMPLRKTPENSAAESVKKNKKETAPSKYVKKPGPAAEKFSPPGLLKTGGRVEKTNTKRPAGGIDEARRLLYAAMGPEKGEALLRRTVPEAVPNPFDFLENYSGGQLALFFRDESAASEALALSFLPSKLTAEALAHTGSERKRELVKRIARMGEISSEVLSRASGALREKVRRFSVSPNEGKGAPIDGPGALAAILKASEFSFGGQLLNELEKNDPELGHILKDRLYTLDDVAAAPDRVIEEKLRAMPDHDIILLLKNKEKSFAKKITDNLSQGREERLREEAEYLGPPAKIEVEAAARDFLAWFRAEGPWIEEEEIKK